MLCIATTGVINAKRLILGDRLAATRVYFDVVDIDSFPNRLVFTISREKINELKQEFTALLTAEHRLLAQKLEDLSQAPQALAVVPFTLRVNEEAYSGFYTPKGGTNQRPQGTTGAYIALGGGDMKVFIRGNLVPTICSGCSRQATLKGKPCPDYQPGSLRCLKSSLFTENSIDAFHINDKGGLVYVAQTSSTHCEQMEADTAGAELSPEA